MNNLLFIDYLSPEGHINFNKLYINSFDINVNVKYILRKDYYKKLKLKKEDVLLEIPLILYKQCNRFTNVLLYICILLYIRLHINLKQYKYIVFSCYETISLYFVPFPKNSYIINHNNIEKLKNRVKFYFFKQNSKRYINIVFEKYIKDYLLNLGCEKVIVSPHGIILPYVSSFYIQQQYSEYFNKNNNLVIFSPSFSSIDHNILQKIISSKVLHQYLILNHVFLLIKYNKYIEIDNCNNIKIINKYLQLEEYKYCFFKSDIILLPYSKTFNYRSSGILFEAIANNKKVLLSKIQPFLEYKNFLKYNAFYFESIYELIDGIEYFIKTKNIEVKYNIDSYFKPSFDLIFKGIDNYYNLNSENKK